MNVDLVFGVIGFFCVLFWFIASVSAIGLTAIEVLAEGMDQTNWRKIYVGGLGIIAIIAIFIFPFCVSSPEKKEPEATDCSTSECK